MVSKAVSTSLGGSPTQIFNTSLRRTLFDTFGTWCEEGSTPGRYRAEVSKMLAVARVRIKDPDTARQYESDMAETADVVEHAAYLAMAAMLLVSLQQHLTQTLTAFTIRACSCTHECSTLSAGCWPGKPAISDTIKPAVCATEWAQRAF